MLHTDMSSVTTSVVALLSLLNHKRDINHRQKWRFREK